MFKRRTTRFQGVSSPSTALNGADEPQGSTLRRQLLSALRVIGNPFVVVGVFGIAYAALGFLFFEAYGEAADHESAIDTAQRSLAAQPDDPDALRTALVGWTAALAAADEMRIQPQFDSSLLSDIMAVADATGARLVSVGLQSDAVAVIDENQYLSTPIRLKADGSLPVIRDFIDELERGAVVALEVQRTEITFEVSQYSAVIHAAVFSQPDGLEEAEDAAGGEGAE